jgi:hypothetical protein
MNTAEKITSGLVALGLIFSLNANAQKVSNDNKLAFNTSSGAKTETAAKKANLTAPVVKEAESSYDARSASWEGNVALIVHQAKSDTISGHRYAKGLANAFTQSDKTGGNPIYISSFYKEADASQTYVKIFVDGEQWDYKGHDLFTPNDAWKLIPLVMADYVKEHGKSKIIPATVDPVLVASNEL